jgi:predicted TPR repeat methyltransferase
MQPSESTPGPQADGVQQAASAPEPGRLFYDELCHAELTAYLQAHPNEFDLIISADTIVYFGDLTDVLPAAASALRDGGTLIFTLEDASPEPDSLAPLPDAAAPFHIDAHGRYAHRPDYVERTLAAAGLDTEIVRAELRMEAGVPVRGLLVRATKAPAGTGVGEAKTAKTAAQEAVTRG